MDVKGLMELLLEEFNWGFVFLCITAVYGLFSIFYSISRYFFDVGKSRRNITFSIILIVRNQEDAIEGIIRSIARRGFLDGSEGILLNLVVVDDYSRDQTPEILRFLAREYKFLKVVRMEKIMEDKSPLEVGLSLCEGEVICILDVGIRIAPEKIADAISYIINKKMIKSKGDAENVKQPDFMHIKIKSRYLKEK
ncbi:Beta-monoglucosyldiacylglycerol synthase [Koleobacter methoxysyntrophicus]|uniref:Beta-monoglucosyldiacylglycerol synthase n=1 Tax=Koleobacter methoxysyntrophicus TaxID=2751313 RepID=A0A8A0RPT8_9FIRM|nr:glycosyltransferase [Koleobacter methoxysyntrophicus]NPV44678.1 glycosyltransferase [Bacillota bacterium]QSQ09417.1 Beta-monoglucosyldiacylglycerol synthase [Koleobacter methoxysyntrophicus]